MEITAVYFHGDEDWILYLRAETARVFYDFSNAIPLPKAENLFF